MRYVRCRLIYVKTACARALTVVFGSGGIPLTGLNSEPGGLDRTFVVPILAALLFMGQGSDGSLPGEP
jgi:hypothetical protein